jgi:glycosyltransferase involved in cell wall biosynthesis
MHVLFIHQAFPAQFGRLALELTKRYGWECSFLVESLSVCPTPSQEMMERVRLYRLPLSDQFRANPPSPWPEKYAGYLELCRAVHQALSSQPDLRPDLIVAHSTYGPPSLFIPEVRDCPVLNYCEYYFARGGSDISYRVDLPRPDFAAHFPRSINAPPLASIVDCAGGYSPTHWQKETFPRRFWPKIEVHFDGIDTTLYRPQSVPPDRIARLLGGRALSAETRLVTYVARGLESMRGFDLFMDVANRIAAVRSDVLFVVIGNDKVFYSWDQMGQRTFKEWVLAKTPVDLSRFVFTGWLSPEDLAELLARSDLHIYLTVPFVLSWSLFNALASGCTVLASDVAPVREVIQEGRHGLLAPLMDTERLAETALRVLADPGAYRPLGQEACTLSEEKYSLEVAIPELRDYFERMGNRSHGP